MYTWIDSADALSAWFDRHGAPAPIALDTEFMRTDTFRAKLALIQICADDTIALIDTVALPQPQALIERLRDAKHLCIMHSAGEDLEALLPMLPDGPARFFDTQIAAAIAGIGFGLSYQKLVAQLFAVELAKSETRSDWLKRPLSAAQLEYAAQDVVWLPRLHERLAARLEELGRSEWLEQECRALIDRICHPEPDRQPQRAFRSAADWPAEQQERLRRLLLWRESTARALDKPRPWILDDARMLQLASSPPTSADDLFERTRGLRALRSAQRNELLELLNTTVAADSEPLAPIPRGLDPAQRRALEAMKKSVADIAAGLGIAEGLLCPRRHLEALLTDSTWPAALSGWRQPILQEALLSKMP